MKTVLVTNGNLSSLLALGEFLKEYGGEITAIFITTNLPSQKNNIVGVLRMLRGSGFRYTNFKLLTNIFLPKVLSFTRLPVSVVQYMKFLGHDIPVIYTSNINERQMISKLETFQPEILLSFSSSIRFSDKIINVPTRAAINAHFALLPAYAGLSPYYWYLKNGEIDCGVTLHEMISKLDAGPIIDQKKFQMRKIKSVLNVLLNQTDLVSPMLVKYFCGESHENHAFSQDISKRSYYRHPNRNDMREFYSNGNVFFELKDIRRVIHSLKNLVN